MRSRSGKPSACGLLVTFPLALRASQDRGRGVRRIGFNGDPSLIDSFNAGLRALGYVEGQNLSIYESLVSGR